MLWSDEKYYILYNEGEKTWLTEYDTLEEAKKEYEKESAHVMIIIKGQELSQF